MIDQLILLCCFLLYLVIQALLINGIYISAYGKTDILSDGSEAHSEMILYPLYRFLNQSHEEKIYFTKDRILAITCGNIPNTFKVSETNTVLFSVVGIYDNDRKKAIEQWADVNLHAKVNYYSAANTIEFYQFETVYMFSKYLRKPIITCVICMASFWSIFTFLLPVMLYFGFSFKIIPIWVVNVFCLSYLNFIIYKPRK